MKINITKTNTNKSKDKHKHVCPKNQKEKLELASLQKKTQHTQGYFSYPNIKIESIRSEKEKLTDAG
jgi:hypothetical protein